MDRGMASLNAPVVMTKARREIVCGLVLQAVWGRGNGVGANRCLIQTVTDALYQQAKRRLMTDVRTLLIAARKDPTTPSTAEVGSALRSLRRTGLVRCEWDFIRGYRWCLAAPIGVA